MYPNLQYLLRVLWLTVPFLWYKSLVQYIRRGWTVTFACDGQTESAICLFLIFEGKETVFWLPFHFQDRYTNNLMHQRTYLNRQETKSARKEFYNIGVKSSIILKSRKDLCQIYYTVWSNRYSFEFRKLGDFKSPPAFIFPRYAEDKFG